MTQIDLLPRPKKIELKPGFVEVPARLSLWSDAKELLPGGNLEFNAAPRDLADVLVLRDESLASEQYELTIRNQRPETILIRARGVRGARHALSTLHQLLHQYGNNLPVLQIDDEPAFPVRGIMLDVSRNRVPTMDELFRLIDQFASWKINHLQLYTEHTFRYRGHNEVWRGASALTPAEVRLLDAKCLQVGITLAANQNCFGHMFNWLKHPRYAGLAETLGDWEWEGRRLPGPFSLCPLEPGSFELVKDLLSQLLPNFSSGLVNIGCDETLDVGQGRSRSEVERLGSTTVYFDFVQKISDEVRNHKFRPMFWADIALSHPDELHKIPKGMISLAWGYEADAPFAEWCKRLSDVGSEVWVCPGTSSWRSITGRTEERQANLKAAVEQGLANGAQGFMITDWGDEGHRQMWPVALIGLAEAADAAWSGHTDPTADCTLDKFLFNDQPGVATWLRELGDVDLPQRRFYGRKSKEGHFTHLKNSSALYLELQHPELAPVAASELEALWLSTAYRLRDLIMAIPEADELTSLELRLTAETALTASHLAIRRVGSGRDGVEAKEFIKRIRKIITAHRILWQLRSRPGGLSESVNYYQKVIERLLDEKTARGGR